jgi:O-antigen/teichoic acid export membrane protein
MITEPPVVSTPQRFLRSTLASYSSLLVRLLVTTAARMLLARFVLPEAHGTYDLALRVVTVASAVRDLGLTYQLMRDERRPYGTVLVFSLLSGAALTLLLSLSAPLAAPFAPELPPVLRVFALWVLLDGLVAVPRTFFERELTIGRLVLPEIARGLLVAVLSVTLAWFGWGVWSLVWGDLAGTALFAALVWGRAWRRVPLQVDWSLVPDLLRRERALFVIWVLFYLVTYLDSFVVRVYTDVATVGQYGRAYFLAFLTRQIVFPRALLPALVEYRDDPRRFAEAFRLGTVFLLFFEVTAGFFLYFNAPLVVELFLGPRWGPAVPLLRILCFVPFLDVFSELGGEILKVRNEDRLWLTIMALNLVSLLGFGVLFTGRWGAAGMAWANFLLAGNLLMAWRLARIFAGDFLHLLRDMAFVYLVPCALFGATALLWAPGGAARLLASALAAVVAAVVVGWRFRPLLLRFLAERAEGRAHEAGG